MREAGDDARVVSFKASQTVHAAELAVENAIFPLDTMFAGVARMRDGATVEIGCISNEGTLAIPLVLGGKWWMYDYLCEVGGEAVAMSPATLERLYRTHRPFRAAMERFIREYIFRAGQLVACNRLHSILERSARWLLFAHDCGRDRISLTHEHLAALLGSRRAGVSVALSRLQQTGAIEYGARYITVTDRRGLESAACECYATLKGKAAQL